MMYATQRPVKLSRIPGILAASLHLKDVFVSYSNLKIQLFWLQAVLIWWGNVYVPR